MDQNSAKAIDLINRYSFHNREIKRLTSVIAHNLDLCPGMKNNRRSMFTDKNYDMDLHLYNWYALTKNTQFDDEYQNIGEQHKKECIFCYNAHLAIQDRKEHRKKFARVKSSITRLGDI